MGPGRGHRGFSGAMRRVAVAGLLLQNAFALTFFAEQGEQTKKRAPSKQHNSSGEVLALCVVCGVVADGGGGGGS
jgi:hypothetical protein